MQVTREGRRASFRLSVFFVFALLPSRGLALPARLALASDRMKNAKKIMSVLQAKNMFP